MAVIPMFPPTTIFSLIPDAIVRYPTIGLITVLGIFAGIQTYRLAEVKSEFSGYKAEVATASLKAEQDARKVESELRQTVDRIATNAAQRQKLQAARAADVSRALDGLRKYIDQQNSGNLPGDPAAASHEHDASAARELLGACAAEYRNVAEDADRLKDQVTTLQEYAVGVSNHDHTRPKP